MGVNQRPIPPAPPKRTNANRVFTLTLIVGFAMGVVASVIVFVLLFLGGFLDGYLLVEQTACEDVCPPLALELYNTLEAEGLLGEGGLVIQAEATETATIEVATLTPSPTSTIDYGPTATAACATHIAQFPGTPCPTITATATPTP
jgi:hypothetical protein